MRGAHLALAVNNPKTTLLMATVKFFGRYNQRNAIREGGCLGYRACAAAGGASEDIHHAQFLDGSAQAGRQLVSGAVGSADHCPLAGLPRRLDPQIAAAFGPGAGEIGVGERFRLVAEQQGDIAGLGLLLQQMQAQAGALDRVGVLPALQGVPWPTPGKAPFFSTTLSRDFDMRLPVRFSISSARRGSVQFGRSDTPGANTASITDKAARAFTGSGPGAVRARGPVTPSRPKSPSH